MGRLRTILPSAQGRVNRLAHLLNGRLLASLPLAAVSHPSLGDMVSMRRSHMVHSLVARPYACLSTSKN